MPYELSTTFKGITTSDRGKRSTDKGGNLKAPLSVSGATGKAKANLSYITRDGVEPADLIFMHGGNIEEGNPDTIEKMKTAIDQQGTKHRKGGLGVRVADKMMVSLPHDATPEEHREMARLILTRICGKSEANALAAIHRDKEGNPHLHILFVDGLETHENAQARKPDAKRVRRQNYGQMSRGGRPKELRGEFAKIINHVGQREGRNFAEHRSLQERGIERIPQIHEGVEVQQKAERKTDFSKPAAARAAKNIYVIFDNNEETGKQFMNNIPSRWKRTKNHLDMWATLFKQAIARREKRKAAAEAEKQRTRDAAIVAAKQAETTRQEAANRAAQRKAAYLAAVSPVTPKVRPSAPPADPDSAPQNQRQEGRRVPGEYSPTLRRSIKDLARESVLAESKKEPKKKPRSRSRER